MLHSVLSSLFKGSLLKVKTWRGFINGILDNIHHSVFGDPFLDCSKICLALRANVATMGECTCTFPKTFEVPANESLQVCSRDWSLRLASPLDTLLELRIQHNDNGQIDMLLGHLDACQWPLGKLEGQLRGMVRNISYLCYPDAFI
jgi:hypothetical protein